MWRRLPAVTTCRQPGWPTPSKVSSASPPAGRFDGSYLRFTDDIEISRYSGGELAETHKDDAIWELMYSGMPAKGRWKAGSCRVKSRQKFCRRYDRDQQPEPVGEGSARTKGRRRAGAGT
jgi:hypothetical protein